MEALLLITEVLTYVIISLGVVIIMICLLFAFKPAKKYKQDDEYWYWEERTDFSGKKYMFPRRKSSCNHFKSHSNDISAGN